MKIKASAEDYLETVLILSERGRVRSVDVAKHMGFAKPTISIIMRQFRDNGYVIFDDDKCIHLTAKGLEIAEHIHARHVLLTDVLRAIGVSEEVAREDACKIEHVISQETYEKLGAFKEKHLGK